MEANPNQPDSPPAFHLTDFQVSQRFKDSFKTALAMTMAFGFALWFEWESPHWAGFAVALISMPTLAASLSKGGERLFGTLMAAPVALLLIAVFPQDRWYFMMAQASWLAFCAYKMSGGRHAYFWFCAGFVTSIITANGGPDPVNAFTITTRRILETSLGIVCFAVVFALIWPVRGEETDKTNAPAPAAPPQRQRLNQAIQVIIAYCSAFFLVIFVPGFPGGLGFLGMTAPFAILFANTPQMRPSGMGKPVALAILLSAPVYFFVLPTLDGFAQLGAIIFAVTFVICYQFHEPKDGMKKTIGLAFFAVVLGISNEQTYSFLSVANTALMFGLLLLLLQFCTLITLIAPEADKTINGSD